MRPRFRWPATLLLLLLVPRVAPGLEVVNGFLSLAVSESSLCAGPGACRTVDVSVDSLDVLLFDLHVDWDPGFWTLDAIVDAAVDVDFVEMDAAQGYIDDLFGDVGLAPPVGAGEVLFRLRFEVTGDPMPVRTVLEIGDLSMTDAFFDRAVLVADAGFDTHAPTPNASIVTPEPGTALLAAGGLVVLAARRRRRAVR